VAHELPSWVALAHLIRPQGRKGELLAELLTDFPEQFKERKEMYLAAPGFEGNPIEEASVVVTSYWLPQGKNQGRVVLEFSHVHSIEEAERLTGFDVVVPEERRHALTDGSMYIDGLIGCTVYDGEVAVGPVRDVQHMTAPDGRRRLAETAPLLTVDLEPGEALIPFAERYLVHVDISGKRILMNLPEGLTDINREPAAKPPKATRKRG